MTGPTGSGKTTTLYAAIERIKKQDKNNVIAHKRLTGELNE